MSSFISIKKFLFLILSLSFFMLGAQNKSGKQMSFPSETYISFAIDGAWCWFSDPRAVYYEGMYNCTYSAWVNSKGDIIVSSYNHKSGKIKSEILAENYEKDDHDNPALLFRPDGRLMVFFTKHGGNNPTLIFTMDKPEDISAWVVQEVFLNDADYYNNFTSTNTYVNPVMLSEEDSRIYLFWRGIDNKPCFSFSDDLGQNWSKGRILIMPDSIYPMRRPYLKVTSNNRDKIMFAFTDGHPRNENDNSIYYMYYKNGGLFNILDEKIGEPGDIPVHPNDASLVYNASESGNKAWIWDIAMDKNENPVMVYAKFYGDNNHYYVYTRWNGKTWIQDELVNSGKWFPDTPDDVVEPEPNYSGGICIDHENPENVYLSVTKDSIFEIEKWRLTNEGKWESTSITSGSSKDNVRPFPIRGAGEGVKPQVLWMQNKKYIHYTDFLSSVKMDVLSKKKD